VFVSPCLYFVIIKAAAAGSSSNLSTTAATTAAAGAVEEVLELEMDQLNQHECMSSLISVLRHMQLKGITPAVEQVTTSPCNYFLTPRIRISLILCSAAAVGRASGRSVTGNLQTFLWRPCESVNQSR